MKSDSSSAYADRRFLRNAAPAVVVRGEVNGLGVCRSLGREGVRCFLVDNSWQTAGIWSRYARPVVARNLDNRELIDSLQKLQGSLRWGVRPVLFNTHEPAVYTISKHRRELEAAFRFRLPPHEMVLTLQSKTMFHEFASSNGFFVPKGVAIRKNADLVGLRTLRFPVVAKPSDKMAMHNGLAPRLMVFSNLAEAIRGCNYMLEQTGDIILQEWVEGSDDQIYFCLFYRASSGASVCSFTGRKLLSSPRGVGSTAFCSAAPDARQTLEAMTAAFLDASEYVGMGSMEYKWDRDARRFVMIDPTVGRSDWQEEIATLCGVNIPLAAYMDALELPTPPRLEPNDRVVWQVSAVERLRARRIPFPSKAIVYDGYWRHDDPGPAIIHYSREALVGARSLLGWCNRSLDKKMRDMAIVGSRQ